MVVEHKIGTSVVTTNKKVLVELFERLVKDYRSLKSLYDVLTDYKAGNIDEDDIPDEFDQVHFVSVDGCTRFSKLRICAQDTVNVYFGRFSKTFAELSDSVQKISRSYCAPDEAKTDELLDQLYKVIAGFCFLFGNEFHCFDTVISKELDDQEYDEIMYNYFTKFSIDDKKRCAKCMEFAEQVSKDAETFRIKLDVFDAAPEKEESFCNIVGPDICAIDESLLTMKMVDDVINGKMTTDELLDACGYKDEDSFDMDAPTTEDAAAPSKIEV